MEETSKRFSLKENIKKFFDLYETIFSIIFAAGVVALRYDFPYWKIILWAGTILLAFVYYFRNFDKKENQSIILNLLCQKSYWIGLALMILSITSKLTLQPKAGLLLIFSFLLTTAAIITKIIVSFTKKNKLSIDELIRYFIIALIGIFVFNF